jgi:hypothetical protein
MKKTTLLLWLPILFAAGASSGCRREGPMEKTGEKVDEAVDEAGDELEDIGDDLEKR